MNARNVSPARRAAYQVVLRVFENGAYADRALATAARELDTRDRALAQQIAYGTVQRAGLERAVAFTNAVMRRLSVGLREEIESLPAGPLALSYPDWIWDVWRRDLGENEALDLMQTQNEQPETVVRVVRGEIDGEVTDVPGAVRVSRVDQGALQGGRIWPHSRASILA